MKVEEFVSSLNADFFTGVPDSQLKALCDYLMDVYGIDPKHHIIAANEGNCAALAAGYYLASGKIPVVYMQNSGEGNIINPAASLLNENVYGIPVLFVIGWRGEPGVHDEPQHIYQGMVTLKLLEDMDISAFVIDKDTTLETLGKAMTTFQELFKEGKSAAFVIRKGALSFHKTIEYKNANHLLREEAIKHIIAASGTDPIVSTTGKASRELFEARVSNKQEHCYDFLTVGSMGHSSSIALGIALQKPNTKIWCIDGDGAALMHMGALAVIGATAPANLIHIENHKGAHETVGGMPTVANGNSFVDIAKACGYPYVASVENGEQLDQELQKAKERQELSFIEVKCALGARSDLGRPTTSAKENKTAFMQMLRERS